MFVSVRIRVLFASEKSFANPHPRVTRRRCGGRGLWRKPQMITKEPPATASSVNRRSSFPVIRRERPRAGRGSLWMMCHGHPRPRGPPASALAVACQGKIRTHLRRRVPCHPPVAGVRNEPRGHYDLRIAAPPAPHPQPGASLCKLRGTCDPLHPRASFPRPVPRSNVDGNEKLFIGLVRCISVVRNF